jgi:pyruvate dehydrogenase E1 component alpha subunit
MVEKTSPVAKKSVAKKPAPKKAASKTTAVKKASASAPVKSAATKKSAAPKTAKSVYSASEKEALVSYYKEMLLIRRFEERAARSYTQALIGGYCHLNIGEEAAIVGLISEMKHDDYLFTNYREHGYAIAKGIEVGPLMAELYGRVDGVSKGWGGSMHMFDLTHRLLGGYGIVGGQLPLAAGAALAIDYRGSDEVVVCTMGDGTTNIGAFHESLNIAALWNLPIVFVVINNGLGMGTRVTKSSAEPELWRRASSYRMDAARVDGSGPLVVAEASRIAIEHARAGKPYLLEIMTPRLRGHSVVDPAKYRSPEEVEELKHHDPVTILHDRLLHEGLATQAELHKIEADTMKKVDQAHEFAAASAHPDVETLFDYTYATPVPNDSRRLPGQALFPSAKGGSR